MGKLLKEKLVRIGGALQQDRRGGAKGWGEERGSRRSERRRLGGVETHDEIETAKERVDKKSIVFLNPLWSGR